MVTPEVAPPGRDDSPTRPAPADTASGPGRKPPAARRGLREQARIARVLGLTGAILMGISALGSAAFPVPNPLHGLRVIGLPARNVTLAIAVTYTGLLMVVTAWLWIARMLTARGAVHPAPERRELARTAVLWGIPLALAPPMFSKDIYSYLAQSATLARGIDPYSIGPAQALGVDDPLTRGIPTVWRDTPAPYGPLFLGLGRIITAFSGHDVVLGIAEHRLLALAGVALLAWVLPRLADRFDLDAGLVLWLGAANPLVLFHMVSGIHNESIMISLMLLGLYVMLGRDDRVQPWWRITLGAALIVAAASVKLPALLALGFVGVYLVRKRGEERRRNDHLRGEERRRNDHLHHGRVVDWVIMTSWLTAIAAVVFSVFSFATGLGFNWLRGLSAPSAILSWMSVSTDVGLIAGQVGRLAGLGDHTEATLALARGLFAIPMGIVVVALLLACLRGRLDPVTGTGAGLGAVVLLGPVVHPWYLFWALLPLVATRAMPRYRRAMLLLSAFLALVVPPTGADFIFRAFQLPLSVFAGLAMFALSLLVVRRLLRAPTPTAPAS
ncbi:polyprenol phosphomannose-dependent alpha 1,6 mannosyltransferase MptB [Pseudonocardia sp. C8]|uniref:polyprenol phosphomannose-dependent alpha 1,6 mannosyltransferase MptB n=1 Tax=Pseudonocardia sp. C8 TaxID=2762759 RepID=UPI0016432D2B|nr:polyprenol phosphomannose-dependent alpha 1,6 mannosyltransferase MptB [Pseudonocardia sp. C8]MBC3192515.1 polyprenol phosphomannose-dependent alpha 1,6 mannosyltransferase MptB [Pseudonocardia sp. C8]